MVDPSEKLRLAIKRGELPIVKEILTEYEDLLDNINPLNGWSNLHYSVSNNNIECTQYLLDLLLVRQDIPDGHYKQITNIDEIKLTFKKETFIHIACLNNAFNVLPVLLDYFNVCLDQRDENGNAPTHLCCIGGYPKCLQILLHNGAYPNLQNNVGDTPLHLALEFANVQCLKLLVDFDADDTVLNNNGWTPLDLAFDDNIIKTFKKLKSINQQGVQQYPVTPSQGQSLIYTPPIQSGPFQRSREPSSAKSLTFFNTNGNSNGNAGSFLLSSPNSKVNLPSIQSRKFSLNSSISDELELNDTSIKISSTFTKSNTPLSLDFGLPPRRSSVNQIQSSPRRERPLVRPQSDSMELSSVSNWRPSSMSSRTFRVSRQNTGGDSPTGSTNSSRSRGDSNGGNGGGNGDQLSTHSNGSSSFQQLNKIDAFKLTDLPIDDGQKKRSILSIPILSSRRKG